MQNKESSDVIPSAKTIREEEHTNLASHEIPTLMNSSD
jgi:hypothetical protein